MGARAIAAAAAIAATAGQYVANWTSLDSRPLPPWYDQAKVGIFIHTGVFSVPSWGTPNGGASGEWFWWDWQGANSQPYIDYVAANYPPGWSYADFAPGLTYELFNATAWAELFAAAGARYVVLTSKHHEGWCNWPSATSFNWNSVAAGPHIDIVGELAAAVKATGTVHWGLYHSLFEWFNPLYLQDKANGFNTTLFVDGKTMPELYDLVTTYQPEVIWSDGDWEAPDTYWKSTTFLAWLFNSSPVKDTVVVNDRWGAGDKCKHGSYWNCADRYNPGKVLGHKWENAATVDKWSWGYRRNAVYADFLTVPEILTELVSTVACGGNFLLNVGPAHDGTIDNIFADRLLGMGQWLGVNGEAIYSSTPWRAQNDTAASVWYTLGADGAVYAIALAWPADNTLVLTQPIATASVAASLVGSPAAVTVVSNGASGVTVTLPALNPVQLPCQYAWSVRLTGVQ